jgi:hypothetical protein
MKTVNSLSGGKTSSYIAANYPADYNVFALVRTDDKKCIYPDAKVRQIVSDKIGKEFIGTLEMDEIINTILDLEQFIGKKIIWLSGVTYEGLLGLPQNNVLPSPIRRYCTALLKNKPIFDWCRNNLKNEICEMRIGFRANEQNRANNVLKKCINGILYDKYIYSKNPSGTNKWKTIPYSKPTFPLIKNNIYKDNIELYWKDKPVRFATLNNCVGCFHRHPALLRKLWDSHTKKMQYFADLEKNRKYPNDTLKADESLTYERIKNWNIQTELSFDDFNECDSGYCGL